MQKDHVADIPIGVLNEKKLIKRIETPKGVRLRAHHAAFEMEGDVLDSFYNNFEVSVEDNHVKISKLDMNQLREGINDSLANFIGSHKI